MVGKLVWNPLHNHLADAVKAQRLRLIVAPFIKVHPLEQLLNVCADATDLQVIVRWAGADLLHGSSDVEIYPLLKKRNVQLFCHPRIHLKLFVFDGGHAFHTSGNVTRRGLGFDAQSNVEIGVDVTLQDSDWRNLYALLAESTLIDDEAFTLAEAYVTKHRVEAEPPPPLDLASPEKKQFSKLSLPASTSPDELYNYYGNQGSNTQTGGDVAARCVHDLILYAIPQGLSREAFYGTLESNFKAQPFTRALVQLIETEKSVRFGRVTEWLQRNCSDKPTPYRSELKETVRNLYNWLSYFFEEISWEQPRHSMVIFWRREP